MRVKAGDKQALNNLLASCEPIILSHLIRYSFLPTDERKDVAQTVLLSISLKINEFEFNSNFKTWLYRIVHNAAITYYRKQSRIPNTFVNEEEIQSNAFDSQTYEAIERLEVVFNVLNDQEIDLFYMIMNGYSYEEVSTLLMIPLGTTKTNIYRLRTKVKAIWDKM